MSFLQLYFDLSGEDEEQAVLCPFPHQTNDCSLDYFETNPSAHVNVSEGLFNCKSCGAGHNETSFIQAVYGCSKRKAQSFIKCFGILCPYMIGMKSLN